MFHQFRYEAELYPGLNRLPLHVRMKLDLAGAKLSLSYWLALSIEERRALCHFPVKSGQERQAFVDYLDFLCRKYNGRPAELSTPTNPDLWSVAQIPPIVLERSRAAGGAVDLREWQRWQFHERYALYKTAISKGEPEKFFAVLTELRDRQK